MKRLAKRLFKAFMPRRLTDAIRQRIEARLNRGQLMEVRVQPDGANLRCDVGSDYSFLVPAACREEIAFHSNTREGRAELSGIAEAALRGGVLFDVGAYAGLISVLFCAARPGNRVYSFEPSPNLQERLLDISALNQFNERMSVEPVAVGREKATLEMLVDPAGGFVQIQRFEHSMWAEPQRITVVVESLPDIAARLGVIPDFIKLDIEGYEYEALEGAQAFLAEHRPELFIELHLNYLEERHLSPKRLVHLLQNAGYEFFTYTGIPLRPSAIYDSVLQGLRFVARAKAAALKSGSIS